MESRFAIGIATISRADLLYASLFLYLKRDFPGIKINIVKNSFQDLLIPEGHIANVNVMQQQTNLGVAASWNLLINTILQEYDYALIVHDDVYPFRLNTTWVNKIIGMNKTGLATGVFEYDCFLISRKMWERMGGFDEEFYPMYYEVEDYQYRMHLQRTWVDNFRIMDDINKFGSLANQPNGSIIKMPELAENKENNLQRYISKWGGTPGYEKYLFPFNKMP